MSDFTLPQRKALAIVPHITGFMSVAGSSFIITEILRDRKKLGQIYHRLMLGISSIDLISSGLGFALSTWPIPEETEHVYGAVGNEATCRMQGFAISLSISVPLYNLALAFYFLLVVGYSKKERNLLVLERWSHFLALSYGLAMAIAGLALDWYHNAGLWCWTAFPPCDVKDGDCPEYTAQQHIYRWALYGVPVMLAIFLITVIMCLLYSRVRREEVISRKWRRNTEDASRRLTRQVARQAMCYGTVFYVSWVFPTIARAMRAFGGMPPYAIILLQAVFLPLQGFTNFWVYMRPRHQHFRRRHPDWSLASVLKRSFLITCVWCGERTDSDDAEQDMNPARALGQNFTTLTHTTIKGGALQGSKDSAASKSDIEANEQWQGS